MKIKDFSAGDSVEIVEVRYCVTRIRATDRRTIPDRRPGCAGGGTPPPGDTGCYTMLMFEPNSELMHNYSGMGLGGATGSGIDPFITNKQVVFMGDSTFFHSGQVSISNSIKNAHDITYVILDNQTYGLTTGQTSPTTFICTSLQMPSALAALRVRVPRSTVS